MSKMFDEKKERYYKREILQTIGVENVPKTFGAEKTCYVFHSFVVFKEPLELEGDRFSFVMINKLIKQQNTNYLHNAGIKTPRIVDIYYDKGYVYEVQEKAPGMVMSYTNESNILNLFKCGIDRYVSIKDMSDGLRSDFCKKILTYNFNMQKKLKAAPLTQFVEFIKNFKAIQEYGLDLDVHGENFLYDVDKGFSFVDLPAYQSSARKRFDITNVDSIHLNFDEKKVKKVERFRTVKNYTLMIQICGLFFDFLKYSAYCFETDLITQMRKNNAAIIKNKILPAAKLAGINLTEQEMKSLENYIKKFIHVKNSDAVISF